MIRFNRYRNDKNALWEINAADMTEEFRRAEQLAERNRELQQQSERLRAYSRHMVELTKEKEEAEARAGIHDRLNRVIFATLHSLEEEKGEEEALSLWKGNLLLLQEERGRKVDLRQELREAADSIGLKLQWEGDLPRFNPKRILLMSVAGECMINAVRHGGAEHFVIRSGEERMEFENDGAMPVEPIRFGSGLSTICSKAGQWGRTVTVSEREPFCLQIRFLGKKSRGT